MRRPSVLIVLACSLVALPANGSDFWEQGHESLPAAEEAEPKAPETFDDLVVKAEKFTSISEQYRAMAFQLSSQNQKPSRQRAFTKKAREAARQAIRYYDQALELRPDEADLHFRCGRLTYTYQYEYYDTNGPVSMRDKAGAHAVEHWAAFERIAPDDPRHVAFVREGHRSWDQTGLAQWAKNRFMPLTYQFARSIYYTKLGGTEAYEKAIEDYDFLLGAAPRNSRTSSWIAQLLTNSAEIHMAIGNLDEAIERYRDGLDYAAGEDRPLYQFGLAVALDRAGEQQSALEAMGKALDADPQMTALAKRTVFFIPKGDIHYYFGLAYAAQGKKTEALLHFRSYVDRIEDTRYIEHARDHIDRLDRLGETNKRRK